MPPSVPEETIESPHKTQEPENLLRLKGRTLVALSLGPRLLLPPALLSSPSRHDCAIEENWCGSPEMTNPPQTSSLHAHLRSGKKGAEQRKEGVVALQLGLTALGPPGSTVGSGLDSPPEEVEGSGVEAWAAVAGGPCSSRRTPCSASCCVGEEGVRGGAWLVRGTTDGEGPRPYGELKGRH
jgi:hypothetical protein